MTKEYVSTKIIQLLKERNWTLYRLAKESGVQNSTIKNICIHNTIPTIPTLIRICNGFGITLSEFFDEGTTAIDQLPVSDQQLLTYFHNMAKDDKELAASYMHNLLKHVPNTMDNTQNTSRQTPALTDEAVANTATSDTATDSNICHQKN